ncbi:neurofilament medium polypeptide-like [Morone saxatilis]|uniref:neurofilament medium polypeptide-like n=1 Tax=Morone saxatilis TaxID=34816 RepID=UPI0015E2363C|nr:neurofilament medium polypeptide-like [Morone saxatilis]
MAKRKSKKPQQEDTSILLDSPVAQSRASVPAPAPAADRVVPQSRNKTNSYASSALLFIIIFTVGASIMGWCCAQQQHSLDQLSESFTTMQKRITNLQQVMEMTDAQTDTDLDVEKRIFALDEAQKQAQETAEVALATAEKLKNSDLLSQLLDLHDEMDTRLAEIKQVSLAVTNIQAMFKNQSEEFETVKESVEAGLSSSSALAESVAELASAVASTCSRVDEQIASVDALNAQLEGQASELNELKDSMYLHNVALYTNNQETAAVKELVQAMQAVRAQALEEMLSSVQMTLDEQFFTSQTLHSSVMAHLQTFHTQLANAPSWSLKLKSNDEGPAAEQFISSTAQNATEVKLEDVEEKAEQQDADDEAEEEAKEENMQEEQPLEQEVDGDVTEGQEEEEITEEEEEITPEEQEDITGQSAEFAEETAEDEITEETVNGHVLDESLQEEVSEEGAERWKSEEEELAELNFEAFADGNEEDE